MQQICAVFGNLEGSLIGLKFSNSTESIGNYTYWTGMVMLLVSAVFFTLLGFYLDQILPRTYGERKKCCFCFTMCCKRPTPVVENEEFDASEQNRRKSLKDNKNEIDPFETKYLDKENYEPVAPEVARLELENQYLKI